MEAHHAYHEDITFTNKRTQDHQHTHNYNWSKYTGKTNHITVANTYFPPRDTTSPHYQPVDTNIAYDTSPTYQTQYLQVRGTHTEHSGTHTLMTIQAADPRHNQQLRTHTKHRHTHQSAAHKTTAGHITTISPTLYNLAHNTRTKLRSPSHNHNNQHTHQIQTTVYNKTDTHTRTIGKQTGHNSLHTRRLLPLTYNYHQISVNTASTIFTNIFLHADKHNIQTDKIHSTCKLHPEHII